jgi:hypothetical protein
MPYFDKFPNIYYNNQLCKDITRRVKIVEGGTQSPSVFYPYELKDHLRPDVLSEFYYEDSTLDWLILLTNDIVDPYYHWYLNQENFDALMRCKYGSVEKSQKLTKFYRNNWYNDDEQLTVSFYNNNLPNLHKKYYTPIFGIKTDILSYKRKEESHVVNTNQIMQYTISSNTNISFTVGEIVDFKWAGQDSQVGTGEVVMCNNTTIRVQSVRDEFTANSANTMDIVGEDSGANVTVNATTTYFTNFTSAEGVFWERVSFYDWENEINEEKKNLKIIGDDIQELIVDEFTTRLRENVNEETGLVEE